MTWIFIHCFRFRDLVQLCLAVAVDAVATHWTVGVCVAAAAGRKGAAAAIHAEVPCGTVPVSVAVAPLGECLATRSLTNVQLIFNL